jgi:hypothetical protein
MGNVTFYIEQILAFQLNYTEDKVAKQFIVDFTKPDEYEDTERNRDYVVTAKLPNVEFTVKSMDIICNGKAYQFAGLKFGPFDEPVSV